MFEICPQNWPKNVENQANWSKNIKKVRRLLQNSYSGQKSSDFPLKSYCWFPNLLGRSFPASHTISTSVYHMCVKKCAHIRTTSHSYKKNHLCVQKRVHFAAHSALRHFWHSFYIHWRKIKDILWNQNLKISSEQFFSKLIGKLVLVFQMSFTWIPA